MLYYNHNSGGMEVAFSNALWHFGRNCADQPFYIFSYSGNYLVDRLVRVRKKVSIAAKKKITVQLFPTHDPARVRGSDNDQSKGACVLACGEKTAYRIVCFALVYRFYHKSIFLANDIYVFLLWHFEPVWHHYHVTI